jgi:hypothetical protein
MIDFQYKVGTKLMCIKTFHLGDDPTCTRYTKGICIEIIYISQEGKYFPIEAVLLPQRHHNMLFSIKEIQDNFISIAEWREEQINSILND